MGLEAGLAGSRTGTGKVRGCTGLDGTPHEAQGSHCHSDPTAHQTHPPHSEEEGDVWQGARPGGSRPAQEVGGVAPKWTPSGAVA